MRSFSVSTHDQLTGWSRSSKHLRTHATAGQFRLRPQTSQALAPESRAARRAALPWRDRRLGVREGRRRRSGTDARSAGADQENARNLELALAAETHVGDDEMPAVAQDLVVRKPGERDHRSGSRD